MSAIATAPWYRHRWPWIVMSGPAIVVVAGLYTAFLAVRSDDGLVAEDYYKQGLAINRMLERKPRVPGLQVDARLAFEGRTVRATLSGASAASAGLRLILMQPAFPAQDQDLVLDPVGANVYEGRLREVPQGGDRQKAQGGGRGFGIVQMPQFVA